MEQTVFPKIKAVADVTAISDMRESLNHYLQEVISHF